MRKHPSKVDLMSMMIMSYYSIRLDKLFKLLSHIKLKCWLTLKSRLILQFNFVRLNLIIGVIHQNQELIYLLKTIPFLLKILMRVLSTNNIFFLKKMLNIKNKIRLLLKIWETKMRENMMLCFHYLILEVGLIW